MRLHAGMIEVPSGVKKHVKMLIGDVPHQILSSDPKNIGGKGNWVARVEARNLFTGATVDISLRGGEKYEQIDTEWRNATYSYFSEGDHFFMDIETCEEMSVSTALVGELNDWLVQGASVAIEKYHGQCITIRLKEDIVSEIKSIRTFKGSYSHIRQKSGIDITLANGVEMRTLKSYLKEGDRVQIDPTTFEITGRA